MIIILLLSPIYSLVASEGPEWDLTPLYPSKKAWLEAIDTAKKDHKALSACQKILTKDAMSLKKCLSGFSDPGNTQLEVSLPGGVVVRGTQASQLAELVQLLRA